MNPRVLYRGSRWGSKPRASTIYFFADDSFLFGRGTLEECENIKQILHVYQLASGQAVNLEKSCVSFSTILIQYDKQLLEIVLE